MQRFSSYPFALFHQVEQLEHTVVLPQFLHYLLVLEVHLVWFFQPTIHVLQFVVQFHLSLNQSSHTDQNILYRGLTVYLLNFYTAEIFHFSEIRSAFADAAAQTIDIRFRRKEKDHVRGETESLVYDLIKSGVEILHKDLFMFYQIEVQFCERRLNDHHIDIAPFYSQKFSLTELYIRVNFVDLGIVQQKSHLFFVSLVCYHLYTGVDIRQFNGITANSRKSVKNYLRPIAFTGNVFRDLFRRIDSPRDFIDFDPLIKFFKEDIALVPMLVELVFPVLLLLLLVGTLLADLPLQQSQPDTDVHSRNLHQKLPILSPRRKQDVFCKVADGAIELIHGAHAIIVAKFDIDSLSKVTIAVLFGLPGEEGLAPLAFFLLHAVLSLGVSVEREVVVHPEGLLHLVVVARVVRLTRTRIRRCYYRPRVFLSHNRKRPQRKQARTDEGFQPHPQRWRELGGVAGFSHCVRLFHVHYFSKNCDYFSMQFEKGSMDLPQSRLPSPGNEAGSLCRKSKVRKREQAVDLKMLLAINYCIISSSC